MLTGDNENEIIRDLQPRYGLNKRQVNAIRSEVKGAISSAKECRKRYIKTIERQLKSTKQWRHTAEKSLDKLPDACSIRHRQHLRIKIRFIIHQKKRRLHLLTLKLQHLKDGPLQVQSLQCPIAIEDLDFAAKKSQMREQGRRYARMLSGFVYGKITELLEQKGQLAGVELIKVNPAYSSFIGLVKFMKQYGLSSDTAAAMVLARRAMRLSERVPNHRAYAGVKSAKHSWSAWNALHKKLKPVRRHQYYTLANSQPCGHALCRIFGWNTEQAFAHF